MVGKLGQRGALAFWYSAKGGGGKKKVENHWFRGLRNAKYI